MRATPRGSEGLGFALMISINNFTRFGTDFLGSFMLDKLHLPFSALVLANAATTAIAVPLVLLLPLALVGRREGETRNAVMQMTGVDQEELRSTRLERPDPGGRAARPDQRRSRPGVRNVELLGEPRRGAGASTTWAAQSTYARRRSSLQPFGGLAAIERTFEVLSASLMIWAAREACAACSTCSALRVSFVSDLSSVTSRTSPATR